MSGDRQKWSSNGSVGKDWSPGSKWDSMGTILNSPLLGPQTNGKDIHCQQLSTLMSDHQKNEDPNSGDDYQFNSETQRLHESEVCDELFDENYNSFNWKLYKGIIFSSLSSVFFSLCSVIVKYLDVSIDIKRNVFLWSKSCLFLLVLKFFFLSIYLTFFLLTFVVFCSL